MFGSALPAPPSGMPRLGGEQPGQRRAPGATGASPPILTCMNLQLMAAIGLLVPFPAVAQDCNGTEPPQFGLLCAACHGNGGAGGDRAPALVNNRGLRSRSEN